MVTARERFLWKKLREKYGIVGEVAGRYIAAGYGVTRDVKVGDIRFDLVASKDKQRLAIKIFHETKEITPDIIEAYALAAKRIGSKPVIILYGKGPRISEEALNKAIELDVSLKRIQVRT